MRCPSGSQRGPRALWTVAANVSSRCSADMYAWDIGNTAEHTPGISDSPGETALTRVGLNSAVRVGPSPPARR